MHGFRFFCVILLRMLLKSKAIVLHQLKYGDSRVIVDLFTREQGRLSVIVSVPKTQRGKLKKQYFQPLTLLSTELDLRPLQQLQKLRDASLLSPYSSLYADPTKLSIALFVAEFLFHALKSEQQNVPLFDYLASAIEWLDGSDDRFANFHLVFLMRLSLFLGFYPNLDGFYEGAYYDLRQSTFCGAPPLHRDFLMPDDAAKIGLLMRMDFTTMHLFQLSHADRNRILDVLLSYYRLHLPAFPELRSVAVLREIYS